MHSLTIKFIKVLFYGILPLLLTSSAGKDGILNTKTLEGTYLLQLEEGSNYWIRGTVGFTTTTEAATNGECFSVLKLTLFGDEGMLKHTMEVIVSKENSNQPLSIGDYKVKKMDSFLNPSDGMFAAFSSDVLGEQLFFTKKGNIRITHFCGDSVKGSLRLILKNQKGKEIRIRGDFDAK